MTLYIVSKKSFVSIAPHRNYSVALLKWITLLLRLTVTVTNATEHNLQINYTWRHQNYSCVKKRSN